MQTTRVRKLRNVPKRDKVIDWLIEKLEADPLKNDSWPMLSIINRPDYPANLDRLYILEDKGVLVPAHIIVDGDEAVILWVDPNRRGNGYAKFMIDALQIKYCAALESSVEFWKKIGFQQLNSNGGEIRMKRPI